MTATVKETEQYQREMGCAKRTYLIKYLDGGDLKTARITCCSYDFALYRFDRLHPNTPAIAIDWL